ncbi:MAG TPA: sigma-70 family RNA polymerase sigma factor [Polyangiaceae bacterium]|nr:sigma-70 family RNA polymerase sigma factor [Polyangiaceae bacterium]
MAPLLPVLSGFSAMEAASPPTKSGAGPTDAALVIAARAGESWAQEALFRRHARMALGLAHRVLPQASEVDDLVQDAFLYAFEHLERLQNPQAFASWLGSIVVRTASKRLRRQRLLTRLGLRRSEPIDLDQVIGRSAPADVALELRAVYGILERLPVEERIALVLRRVETMTVEQIAETMNLSVSTVKRRLAAAEGRLEQERRA